MELATFAIKDGFSEAILRGLRSSFLTEGQYAQMKNCNNLQELKTFLEETDYSSFLAGQEGEVTIPILKNKLRQKLAGEFDYIASQSVPPLSDFIHLMCCQYMIDNVINMIEGLKQPEKNNSNSLAALLANTDPLGYFPEMKNIKILEGEDYAQLYRDVLIDTPVGPYFMQFLEETLAGSQNENRTLNDVQNIFKDMKTVNIKTSLKKIWLEDFYAFCENNLEDTSSEMMLDLLNFEADTKAIQVVHNTLANEKGISNVVITRKQLIPAIGYLYPDCQKAIYDANTLEALREAVKGIQNYKEILKDVADPQKMNDNKQDEDIFESTIDDYMYLEEVRKYSLTFDQASQYAVFYSYLKLKEQEIRNIVWIAELIQRNQDKQKMVKGFKKIIIPFSSAARQGKTQ